MKNPTPSFRYCLDPMQSTKIEDVLSWADQLDVLSSSKTCKCPKFLKPFHFAMLGTRLAGKASELHLPESVAGYAARMHLWSALGLPQPSGVVEHPENCRFAPVERLEDRDSCMDKAQQLALIATLAGTDSATVNSLEISLCEIIENCHAHAETRSKPAGIACAQNWPKGNRAQIAISDNGIGIRASLSENALLSRQLQEENSCELAAKFGVTSKPGRGHAGYGLALAKELLRANEGTLLVLSHNEWFRQEGTSAQRGNTKAPWPGTLVVIEWRCDRPLRVRDVYDSWPQPEGMTDDDFNFDD